MKHFTDIALAGSLGAAAGVLATLILEWHVLFAVPVAIATAFLSYRPTEIRQITKAFASDASLALGKMEEILPKENVLRMARNFLFGLVMYAIAIGSIFILPLLLVCTGAVPNPVEENYWKTTMAMGALLCVFGIATFLFVAVMGNMPRPAACPFCWWMARCLGIKNSSRETASPEPTRWLKLTLALLIPPILQLTVLLLPLVIFDVLLSLTFVCCSTRRLASVYGAVIGYAASIACWPEAPLAITTAAVVGWFAGPLLYVLREKAATKLNAWASA